LSPKVQGFLWEFHDSHAQLYQKVELKSRFYAGSVVVQQPLNYLYKG